MLTLCRLDSADVARILTGAQAKAEDIGAIRVSSGTPAQDLAVAEAGVQAFEKA